MIPTQPPSATPHAPEPRPWTVVQAAAGCGKTTDLARRYLALVASGVPVDQTVAITFTRKAAAELQERVTLALRACLDGPIAERARRRLGEAWPLYAEVAPRDRAVVRAALAALPDAPIGTTDSFIQALLTELALDASLPLPDGTRAFLDVPIRAAAGVRSAFERTARRLLDPPDGSVDPDVSLLARYFSLDEILGWICHRTAHDHLPAARAEDLLRALAREMAVVLRRHDLAAAWRVRDPGSLEAWLDALDRGTNIAGKWAVPAVAAWLHAGGAAEVAPYELPGWLRGLPNRSRAQKQIRADLERTSVDLGIGRLDLWDVIDALRYPYEDPAHVRLSDALRLAFDRLRMRVVTDGLRAAAEAGELGHDELAEAAIALCERPPPRLHGRFRALLVDEVQDANATQLRLYRALARLPGPEPVRTYFVGDGRQSIYLFRHAEPAGFVELAHQALEEGGEVLPLEVNHRSSPELVGATRALFAAAEEPLRAAGLAPLEALSGVRANPDNARLSLDPARHDPAAPVWLVRGEPGERLSVFDVDPRALHAFWERLQVSWEEGPHTAAVLAPTWARAREACALLRRWAGRDDVAFVEGGVGPVDGRVPTDLRHLVAALLDPTDDVAWLGVWKHPAVGLSEAALARARAAVGLEVATADGWTAAPAWVRTLGTLVDADRLAEPHAPHDQLAFARAVGPLREARDRLGRGETAEILDEVVTALGWRTVYAGGPGGEDDLALLEVLLDHVRSLSADGLDPHGVLAALSDDEALEPPQLHVDRPERYVACTTVFQAKGRAWDHVMVWSPGRSPRGGALDDAPTTWIRLGGEPMRLFGLKFDPTGGLSPFKEPLGRLAARIELRRSDEECVRLAYVAVTRARRTVTFGVPDDDRWCQQAQGVLAKTWASDHLQDPGIAVVRRPAPPEAHALPAGWAAPSPGARFVRHLPADAVWHERAPSSAAAQLTPEQRLQQADWIASRVRLTNGLHLGVASVDPPDHVTTGAAAREVHATTWGELAHGWFAAWRFQGEPRAEQVESWLADEASAVDPAVRDWLLAVSRQVATVGGPLWELVTDPSARLHFELPFVGVGRSAGQDLLLSGRIDLLVERRRQVTVVDFKAGGKAPTGHHDLIDAASLRTYGPQLEAYRAALERMGRRVEAVALWFVRTGTSVRW